MRTSDKVQSVSQKRAAAEVFCVQWGLGGGSQRQAKASFGPKMPSLRVADLKRNPMT